MNVYTNGNDYVVAESLSDAIALYCATMGKPSEHEPDVLDFVVMSDDALLTVNNEDGSKLTLPCGRWCETEGRGYLASKDW